MKGSDFISDYVSLLYYNCHKIKMNYGESYINSPLHLKTQKSSNKTFSMHDDKCFQYAATVALNHKEIEKKNEKRISKIKYFID